MELSVPLRRGALGRQTGADPHVGVWMLSWRTRQLITGKICVLWLETQD